MLLKNLARQALLALGLLMVAAGSCPAAVTIDFGTGPGGAVSSPYQEDGFSIAGQSLILSGAVGNPVRSILLDNITTTLTITNVAGSPFSLLSLDHLGLSGSFSVTGTKSDGSAAPATETVNSSNTWETYPFVGFTGLNSLVLTWTSGSIHFDNIVLDVVPLPAALPLLASGIAALGWVRRRQRKVA